MIYIPGLTVNGLIVGKINPKIAPEKHKTYFGKLAVMLGAERVVVAPSSINVNGTSYKWRANKTITSHGVTVDMFIKNHMTISVGKHIKFAIIRHLIKPTNPNKVSFLGFYIVEDTGLTEQAHGLLGRFNQVEYLSSSSMNVICFMQCRTLIM